MYRFVSGISAQEHDAFVKATTKCNLLQSAAWGKIKANWKHEIIGVYDGEQLVASALALIKNKLFIVTLFPVMLNILD